MENKKTLINNIIQKSSFLFSFPKAKLVLRFEKKNILIFSILIKSSLLVSFPNIKLYPHPLIIRNFLICIL